MSRYTPLWLQQGSYAASVDRRLIAALWPTPASSGAAATVSGGTMSVSVAAGSAAVPSQNGTGATLCVWDAPELVTHSAAPGSPNSRIDIITVHPRANDLDNGSNNDFIIDIVVGTPATSPAAPAVPAGQIGIWQVMVPTGAAALVQGNLTDARPGGLSVPASGTGSPPRGYVASAVGPASAVAAGSTAANIMTLTAPVAAGRRYRISAFAGGTQSGAIGGQVALQLANATNLDNAQSRFGNWVQLAVSAFAPATGVFLYSPAASSTQTWTLQALATAGTFTIAVNNCQMILEDIGSQ